VLAFSVEQEFLRRSDDTNGRPKSVGPILVLFGTFRDPFVAAVIPFSGSLFVLAFCQKYTTETQLGRAGYLRCDASKQ
jgi:hypothetical protein